MMEIVTITGQSLEDFFRPKIPQGLIKPLVNKLKVLESFADISNIKPTLDFFGRNFYTKLLNNIN